MLPVPLYVVQRNAYSGSRTASSRNRASIGVDLCELEAESRKQEHATHTTHSTEHTPNLHIYPAQRSPATYTAVVPLWSFRRKEDVSQRAVPVGSRAVQLALPDWLALPDLFLFFVLIRSTPEYYSCALPPPPPHRASPSPSPSPSPPPSTRPPSTPL